MPTAPTVPTPSPAPLIELRSLTKTYEEGGRQRTVLCDASTTIARGEMAVLVGRSGSGKSTLLNLLSGIDLPTSGEVVVDGVDIGKLTERERTLFRRDRIGFVFQFFNLMPTLTVRENRAAAAGAEWPHLSGQRAGALDLLARWASPTAGDVYPDRLSGGEQQRIAVARALSTTRCWCWPMSRPATWMKKPASRCSNCWTA